MFAMLRMTCELIANQRYSDVIAGSRKLANEITWLAAQCENVS